MVITTSEASTASPVRIFGLWVEMSIPTSAMAATAAGLTASAGALPAERTSTAPPARAVRNPAAIWDRPARACLASRIPHFSEVTESKLTQLGAAEKLLRDLGFRDYRVRHHDKLARIELGADEWQRLTDPSRRGAVDAGLRALGFASVSLDLRPFSSGSLSAMSRGPRTRESGGLTGSEPSA